MLLFLELVTAPQGEHEQHIAHVLHARQGAPGLAGNAVLASWQCLLAMPGLRLGKPLLPSSLADLEALPAGLRALALLVVLARLQEDDLALLLKLPVRQVTAGMVQLEKAGLDVSLLSARIWPMLQDFSVNRMAKIARARQQLTARVPSSEASDARPVPWRGMLAVAGLGVLAMVMTFLFPDARQADSAARLEQHGLGGSGEAASRFSAEAGLLGHPDRALLEIPPRDAEIAVDTAFFSWYQAERLGVSNYEPPLPSDDMPERSSISDAEVQDAL